MRVVTHQRNEKGEAASSPPTREEIEEFGGRYFRLNSRTAVI